MWAGGSAKTDDAHVGDVKKDEVLPSQTDQTAEPQAPPQFACHCKMQVTRFQNIFDNT